MSMDKIEVIRMSDNLLEPKLWSAAIEKNTVTGFVEFAVQVAAEKDKPVAWQRAASVEEAREAIISHLDEHHIEHRLRECEGCGNGCTELYRTADDVRLCRECFDDLKREQCEEFNPAD